MIEGYLPDGSFAYRGDVPGGYEGDASFVSHSHGWSTGPTYALTTFVVGLEVIAPAGRQWSLKPQFGDLESAEGGFTTPLRGFSAGWMLNGSEVQLWYLVPAGTNGTLVVPGGSAGSVVLDGKDVSGKYDEGTKSITVEVVGDGEKHEMTVSP